MTKREIAAVACRLAALAMFAFGWVTLARPIGSRLAGESLVRFDNAMPVAVGIVWLIMSVYIWSRADDYAARMFDEDPNPVTSPELTAEDVLSLGTAVMGIWLAGPAFINVINLAIEWGPDFVSDASPTPGRALVRIFGEAAVQLLVGIYCVLGSRTIAAAIHRVRTAGTPATNVDEGIQREASSEEQT